MVGVNLRSEGLLLLVVLNDDTLGLIRGKYGLHLSGGGCVWK